MTAPAPEESPGVAKVAAAVALLAAAGSAGFIAYRIFGTPHSGLVPTHAGGAVSLQASAPESESSRKIPEQIPDLSLPDAHGMQHKLSQYQGRPLMLNFWATWCDPCRREIPLLKSLRRERQGESLEIVGIAVDFKDAVIQYADSIGIDYPLLIGEKDGMAAIEAFGMETVFPFTVFADAKGRILTIKVGELHRDEAEVILDGLRDVDSGNGDLPAVRQRVAAEMERLESTHLRQSSTGTPTTGMTAAGKSSELPRS
jgi:thiol-disulfide isomerase/thioredoxin